MAKNKTKGEIMTPRHKPSKRKPVKVTFIMSDDYVHNTEIPEKVRFKYLKAIQNTMKFVGLNDFDIITMASIKEYTRKMIENNIPELWTDDLTGQSDKEAVFFYYVVDFNDSSRKMLFFIDRESQNKHDPMFQ